MPASKRPKPAEIREFLRKKLGFWIDKSGFIHTQFHWDAGREPTHEERRLWRLAWRLTRERLTKTEDNECGCPIWGSHRITCRRSFA